MKYSRCEAVIDLDAIHNNVVEMKQVIAKETNMILVIKADGYGHGATEIARETQDMEYVFGFATATIEEAVKLRKDGITKPILVLGRVFPEQFEMAVSNEIRIPVFLLEDGILLSQKAAELKKDAFVHFKIDTGMKRIGFQVTEKSADEIAQISSLPYIISEGIFTHFYLADVADKTLAHQQMEQFLHMIDMVEQRGVKITMKHCSNSAGIVDMPEANMDAVRAGITLYGLWPSDEVDKSRIFLEPVMSIQARIAHVKELAPGDTVGYGATYIAREKRQIATIAFGYADGYPRGLSNKGWVLIHGQKAPLIGRICMDQCMVDITGIEGVTCGEVATLIGRDGEGCITMEMMGDLSGRFNYEFACDINPRVPRVYKKNGEEVSTRTNF